MQHIRYHLKQRPDSKYWRVKANRFDTARERQERHSFRLLAN